MSEQRSSPVRFLGVAPSFAVRDVVEAAEYYRDRLGFEILGYFAEPPVYAMVRRGIVQVHFGRTTADDVRTAADYRGSVGIDAYVWVEDADRLYDEFTARGANIVEGPVDRVYNCREIVVRDPNGFTIAFGSDVPER